MHFIFLAWVALLTEHIFVLFCTDLKPVTLDLVRFSEWLKKHFDSYVGL